MRIFDKDLLFYIFTLKHQRGFLMNQSIAKKDLLSLSLAIFCMLFGAGNLIFPLTVGKMAGNYATFGILGFFITAILLPLAGLVAMIFFDGNYKSFFHRVGKLPGDVIIFVCMVILGPIIVVPRCVTLSHTMIAPFIPWTMLQTITPVSSLIFCLFFLSFAFVATYRQSRIVSILGDIIAPVLLASIALIIGKGIISAKSAIPTTVEPLAIFKTGFMMGYQTLDLLGTLFFASIIVSILKKRTSNNSLHSLALYGLKAGALGLSLLGCVYIGMSMLGVFHSHNFLSLDSGSLFLQISLYLLGSNGAAVISVAVLLACVSTVIGLGAVLANYLRTDMLNNTISYVQSLVLTYLSCIPLSIFGLKHVLAIAGGPIVFIGYPVLITITFCNIAYKVCNFTPIKVPVIITFLVALVSYIAL
jgi:LIVCS family branched-chain amino acid:cation transporter